jgi:hypothetical protein
VVEEVFLDSRNKLVPKFGNFFGFPTQISAEIWQLFPKTQKLATFSGDPKFGNFFRRSKIWQLFWFPDTN